MITKPEVVHVEGTSPQLHPFLIGIVKSYVPYEEVAVSRQAGQPRVAFQENSGLALVHPVDCINETIEQHLRRTGHIHKIESRRASLGSVISAGERLASERAKRMICRWTAGG